MFYKKSYFLAFCFVTATILSCKHNNPRALLESSINHKIPDQANEIKFTKIYRDKDSDRPFNIYIRFNIDSIGFNQIVKDIHLVHKRYDFRRQLCLTGVDDLYVKQFWDFKSESFHQNEITWWDVADIEESYLSGSFYKIDGGKKIQNCYLKDWDGRILMTYNVISQTAYIFISVLME